MSVLALEIPDRTRQALERLAEFTGIDDPHRLTTLIQDALRTYEWVIFQQAQGRTVVALEPADLEYLARPDAPNGEREYLSAYLLPQKVEQARMLFGDTGGPASW